MVESKSWPTHQISGSIYSQCLYMHFFVTLLQQASAAGPPRNSEFLIGRSSLYTLLQGNLPIRNSPKAMCLICFLKMKNLTGPNRLWFLKSVKTGWNSPSIQGFFLKIAVLAGNRLRYQGYFLKMLVFGRAKSPLPLAQIRNSRFLIGTSPLYALSLRRE